ncbi:MAG: hypothetical protein CMJ34_06240 [Phycisphaerae bacterium]|nr:hypothetical protein [Phycisphaerae bacterium]
MSRRIALAIDLGHNLLRAAQVKPGRPDRVISTLFERLPDSVDMDDTEAVGRALAKAMTRAGMSSGPAVFALDRSITSFKRIDLPTTDQDELPDMVRLAVERDLPIDSGEAVIDFTVVDRRDDSTLVEAVAAPLREIERIRDVASAAGLSVARVAPRCHGALRFADPDHPTLLVDITGEGLELVLAADGAIPWSRGVEIKGPDGGPPPAEQLVPETRRSWISYRLSSEEFESPSMVVLGGDRAAEALDAVAEATGLDASRFKGDRRVQGDADMRGVWPLVGLLLPAPKGTVVDLASPRQAPDIAARWRQRVLVIAGLAVISAFAGWTIGNRDHDALQAKADDLLEKARAARLEHLRFKRDGLRAEHLEQWTSIRPDWLEQLHFVAEPTFDRPASVLDDFAGSLAGGEVDWDSNRGFSVEASIRVSVEGEGGSREVVASVRDDLVGDDRFVLRNTVADARGGSRLPFPFGFDLRTAVLDPGPELAPDVDDSSDGEVVEP